MTTMREGFQTLEGEPGKTIFGRLYSPDPRDRNFPMKAARMTLRLSKFWHGVGSLDQGYTPQCVGFSWAHFLYSGPIMRRAGRHLPVPHEVYHLAQELDEWPGTDYEGTSVRAGAKALQRLGLLKEYRWALDSASLHSYILTRGPIVVGTDWYTGMTDPTWIDNEKESTDDAYLEPKGFYQGGHAYMLIGFSYTRQAYRILNSWGSSWAEKGRAWIKRDVIDYLIFEANGEACSATELL